MVYFRPFIDEKLKRRISMSHSIDDKLRCLREFFLVEMSQYELICPNRISMSHSIEFESKLIESNLF